MSYKFSYFLRTILFLKNSKFNSNILYLVYIQTKFSWPYLRLNLRARTNMWQALVNGYEVLRVKMCKECYFFCINNRWKLNIFLYAMFVTGKFNKTPLTGSFNIFILFLIVLYNNDEHLVICTSTTRGIFVLFLVVVTNLCRIIVLTILDCWLLKSILFK